MARDGDLSLATFVALPTCANFEINFNNSRYDNLMEN